MDFHRTSTVLEESSQLIRDNDLDGSPIESYLAQYALICLCAEIEQKVHSELESCVDNIQSDEIKSFIKVAVKKILKSISKGELAGFLGHFGPELKTDFNNRLEGREAEVTLFGQIVKARHSVAHSGGATKSFNEIVQGVEAAEIIITAMRESLSEKICLVDDVDPAPAEAAG